MTLKIQSQTCNPPSNVMIGKVLAKSIQIQWDSNGINPGEIIRVAYAKYPGTNFIYQDFNSNSGGEINGLRPATRYIIRVNKRCNSQHSASISLGTLRTLSLLEEEALCDPAFAGDICDALEETTSGERGSDFIEILFPKPPTPWLTQYPGHTIGVRYRALDIDGNPVGPWVPFGGAEYAELPNGKMTITGLSANTLYQFMISWVVKDASGNLIASCLVPFMNTPTSGPEYIGPYFKKFPVGFTLDCSAPEPYPIPQPPVGGGCSTPKITYSDEITGTGCNLSVTRTWTALDDCGRSSSVIQVVALIDQQPPTFVDVPANYAALECGENLPNEEPTAVDNCSSVTLTLDEQIQQGSGCVQTITRTWTATDACGNAATYQQIIEIFEDLEETNGDDPLVPPLPVECGQNYTPSVNTNFQPLNFSQAGDVLNIEGFPVLLEEVTGSNGVFTGIAKVRLPFGNKVVYVDFSNIQVNTDKRIISGDLAAIPDPNFVMPEPGNFDIGGDICIPEPPYSANGFNNDGQYIRQPPYEGWQPGDPIDPEYDPNGFDANGYHIETGTQFNEDGCSQEGLNENGDPCNPGTQGPYYWLHNNNNNNPNAPTTPEGIAYASELQPNIRAKVLAAINALIAANADLITDKRETCGTVRTDLEAVAAGLDRSYLFGANDEFIAEDMFLQFNSKPVTLQVNVPDRDQQIIDVENKHIELYYCDKLLYKFKQIELILNEFKSPNGLDFLVNDMLDAIKRFTAEKVAAFKANPAEMDVWITDFIELEIQRELKDRGLASFEPAKRSKLNLPNPAPGDYPEFISGQSLAIGNFDETNAMLGLALAQSFETTPEDLEFEFYQGWEYVGNTSRAFYLDAITKARSTRKGYDVLSGQDPESLLPIRIEKEIGGKTYTILLDQIRFTAGGAKLDAYFILEIPNSGQKLVFRALDVAFTPGGLTASGAQLRLESDVSIRLNNTAKLIIKGTAGNTYVNWGCDGFAGMGIQAEVEFCRNFFLPLKPNLEVDPDEDKRVKAYFSTSMPAWGEFVASLNVDPFALAQHPDVKFQVQNAWLDFSDVENPNNFVNIAPNYHSEFSDGNGGFKPQWKGFYLQNLVVTLPQKLNENSPQPIQITVEKFVIDDRGVTGLVSVSGPLVPLSEGNLSGWAFSMDNFTLAVVANRLQGGGFGGLINVPIFGAPTGEPTESDCFRYEAKIIATAGGELYEFKVYPKDSMDVDIWVGKVILNQNSYLQVRYANDEFTLLANLSGVMKVNGDLGDNIKLKLPELAFENVQISNKEPYFRSGNFGVPVDIGANIGGFGLTIKGPTLGSANDQCNLNIGAAIRLVSDSDSKLDIGASTTVVLKGNMVVVNGRQRWKFQDYEVKKITINASWRGVEGIKGELEWYKNDTTFGRGFRGQVAVQFSGIKKLGEFGVEALAQFGHVDDYKYFMVDALVKLGNGVSLGALSLKGFGGGAYYHMDRDSTAFVGLDQASSTFNLPSQPGVSMSGILYTPNKDIGLGIKAMIVLATSANEEIFNAGATFEIRFNDNEAGKGIKDIAFYGSARLMAPIQFGISSMFNSEPTQEAPVSAQLAITYDFSSKTLHGELAVFANVGGVFVGAGDNDLVGSAVIHFDPNKWYINVGTPTSPNGIKFRIPVNRNDGVDLFTLRTYLCIGTAIPPMPPLPSYVREMTGASNFMADESRRATGRGFAFGASVTLNTGEMKFLIFYASLEAGLGFDVMVQKYDEIICANNGNKPLGINGWYASGQAWAYIDAEVGLKFKNKRFTILNIGAAAALQVKLPNPFWARGSVGGRYKILGGLIKGKCNFKFTLGKSCQEGEAGDAIEYVKLIEELSPFDKSEFVDVSSKPVAYFGVPMNGTFTLSDNDGNEKTYSTNLLSAKLTKTDGTPVTGALAYSPDKRQLTFRTPNLLPGNTEFQFIVSVRCMENGLVIRTETDTSTFTTGELPNVILPSNVESSYPLDGMYNFYRNEASTGFIALENGQPTILTDATLEARFYTKDGEVARVPAVFTGISTSANRPGATYYANTIEFDIPSADLLPNKFYRMDLVTILEGEVNGENSNQGSSKPGENTNSSHAGKTGDPIEADPNVARVLYSLYFRTSVYDRFMDKMTYFKNNSTQTSDKAVLWLKATSMEPFDLVELLGTAKVFPLIQYQHGSSDFYEYMRNVYSGLKDYDFIPRYRSVPEGGSLIPRKFIVSFINGAVPDGDLRADVEKFEKGEPGITNAQVELRNLFVSTARSDCWDFRSRIEQDVLEECVGCLPINGSPDGECELPPLPSSGPFPPARCCCSSTYQWIFNDLVLWDIYYLNPPKPASNSIHPVFFSYQLPDNGATTPGVKVDFKHFSNSYD